MKTSCRDQDTAKTEAAAGGDSLSSSVGRSPVEEEPSFRCIFSVDDSLQVLSSLRRCSPLFPETGKPVHHPLSGRDARGKKGLERRTQRRRKTGRTARRPRRAACLRRRSVVRSPCENQTHSKEWPEARPRRRRRSRRQSGKAAAGKLADDIRTALSLSAGSRVCAAAQLP